MKGKRGKRQEFRAQSKDLAFAGAPFFRGYFPDFGREAAGDVLEVFGGDQAHALLLRDAARGDVTDGLGGAEDGEMERLEPKMGDGFAGLGHQTLALPRQA